MAKKHVIEFHLLNVKGYKELSGRPDGRHFILNGKNGVGKSTVFQAILRLIAALPDAEKPQIWLSEGEDWGEIKIKLADNGDVYKVSERFPKGGRSRVSLWKQRKDSDKWDEITTEPQATLKKIFGAVLDITPIIDMKGDDQFDYLQSRIGIDTSGYNNKRDQLNKERTAYKGKKNLLEAIAKEQKVTDEEVVKYAEPWDMRKVMAKKVDTRQLEIDVRFLDRKIDQVEEKKERVQAINDHIKKLVAERELLETDIEASKKLPAEMDAAKKKLEDARKANDKVDKDIQNVSEHNIHHNRVKIFTEKIKEAAIVTDVFNELTAQIKNLDIEFYKSLRGLPFDEIYPGLTLEYQQKDEENPKPKMGLYLNGLPFRRGQLSTGIMIKILIKLSIYLNPDGLNFVYIDDWDKLDDDNKQEVIDFANEQDNVQLGIEIVDNTPEFGIEFIEDVNKTKKTKN